MGILTLPFFFLPSGIYSVFDFKKTMNLRMTLMVVGAVIFGYGVMTSTLGIKILPLGLGFCLFAIGLCVKNPKKIEHGE